MTSAARIRQHESGEWNGIASQFHDYSYRQSAAYARRAAERVGAKHELVSLADNGGSLIGACDVRVKYLPLIRLGIAYVNGGPLVRRDCPDDDARLRECLDLLREEYVLKRHLLLRILSPIVPPERRCLVAESFTAAGFQASASQKPYRTILADLTPSPADLRSALHKKWRNCLSKAERAGLSVHSCNGEGEWVAFAALFRDLLSRKNFNVEQDVDFFFKVQKELEHSEKLRLLVAELEGKVVAGHVASFLGDTAVYLLGATGDLGREANAAYLLLWDSILQARIQGIRYYDLGGIDPVGNPGVFHFKEGVGGQDVVAPGPFEARPRGWRAPLMSMLEHVHRAHLDCVRRIIKGAKRRGEGRGDRLTF